MNKKISIYIHRLYFDGQAKKGGLDQIASYLLDHGFELLWFEFPLDYNQTNIVKITKNTKNSTEILKQIKMLYGYNFINWILEPFLIIYYSILFSRNTHYIITADPLSGLPGAILKRLGFYSFLYHHSIDYSLDRFKNKILNRFYLSLMRFDLKSADLVGAVTRQAKIKLEEFGVKKIIFIPNSPSFESLESFRKHIIDRNKYSLVVTCASVSHKFLIHKMVELTNKLSISYPSVKLNVIGHFDQNDQYCKELVAYIKTNNLENKVKFFSHVSREENYMIIGQSYIGLAFYDGMYSHVVYGDSLKIREYCALGLPVISDSQTYTAIEMAEKGCGFIEKDLDDTYLTIKKLFDSDNKYLECSNNSLIWAKENDKDKIMKSLVSEIFKNTKPDVKTIDYVVFVHRLYDMGRPKLGGLDYVLEYLINKGKTLLLVESPLLPKQFPKVVVSLKSKDSNVVLHTFSLRTKNDYLVWLFGVVIDFYVSLKYHTRGKTVFSLDPLTSFPAIILRKLGYFKFHYYHCTDYSVVRFSNKIINKIYRAFLIFGLKSADLVGTVSRRVDTEVRKFKPRSKFYIPNSPSYSQFNNVRKSLTQRDKNILVLTVAGISKRYKVKETIEILFELKKIFTDLKLKIIGSKELDLNYYHEVLELINRLKLENAVIFTGYVSRDENCDIISRSYIGLAFYDPNDTYSWFSDPLKIREYAVLGIPCVADLVTSAAEEMDAADAGFALKNVGNAVEKITLLLQDQQVYNRISQKALDWAKKFDKDQILMELETQYLAK